MTHPPLTKSGILLIDKPVRLSSATVVGRVKRITRAAKVGHAGTLDPFAGGLLVCVINHGTRISRFFLDGEKSYTAELTFGTETDTLDATGTVIRTCDDDFFQNRPDFFEPQVIDTLLQSFKGPQQQLPPIYSALKHKGVPLYRLARRGAPVQKEARSITIGEITLKEVKPPSIVFHVACSSGTYIRSLAADIGTAAGCGAHLSGLTRTESMGFHLDQALTIDELAETDDIVSRIISIDRALPHLAGFDADDNLRKRIMNGIPLSLQDFSTHDLKEAGCFKIRDKSGNVIALAEYDKNLKKYNYCCVFLD